ncbi:ABC transporter ATP-binding protein [Spiroplasma syrphidicola EA-1]|uniref:ABC transporter ATP-binding protein n=1 Tax=Spiroplasma syrphidicola EA-1 TaxID=1276229 RepID=R4U3G9_9MOLU|nr:ABC transporter ATP-binding protein [Spiroplasma syrphidicola]AGM25952.1 ABC transporter ATP-binding protein [Spiroplasma syrphidicola EA-1]
MMKALFKKKVNNINPNPELAIEIKNFTKKFKKFTAVDNINISVKKGKIHGFIGPNGSGKTTTIKSLIGAIIATNGEFYINGLEATSVDAKKTIGYIPENARFPKHLKSLEYLAEMGYLRGIPYKEAKAKARKILVSLNLIKFKSKNPNTFSSGMKKKILLAQALMADPEVLILDEPAANLDPTARQELFNDLIKLRDQGKTILICSHILSELQDIADEITILNYGKVVYYGEVINASHNYFQFTVMEPEMLEKLGQEIKKLGYEIIHQFADSYVIKLNDTKNEIKRIAFAAFEQKIILIGIQPYFTNITKIYDDVVFSNNKNFGQASALVS